jgi:hypothetical protein
MSTLPVPTSPEPRLLTAAAFQGLADVENYPQSTALNGTFG